VHDLGLKVEDNLTDYLNFKIVQERDKGNVWVIPPYIIENLEKNFGEKVSRMQCYTIPGMPRFKIVRPTKELEVIDSAM
jgi:hypothetical protein